MTGLNPLIEAQRMIGQHWKKGQSPEQEELLGYARDVLFFISSSGQFYHFEDYRKQHQSVRGLAATGDERVRRTADFFEQLLGQPQSAEDRARVLIILDALSFVAATGQLAAFKSYPQHLESHAPPQVVASFETREQAETWLKNHPAPPHMANILIAGRYHTVAYDRGTNGRYLPRARIIEYYLAGLKHDSPPAPVASFDSLQDAEAWMSAQPAPPARAWVLISGEVYLAVSLPNVNHRALYPLALADGLVINTEVEPEGV